MKNKQVKGRRGATVRCLLKAQDAITHAISNLVDADNEIEKVVRVLEKTAQYGKRIKCDGECHHDFCEGKRP